MSGSSTPRNAAGTPAAQPSASASGLNLDTLTVESTQDLLDKMRELLPELKGLGASWEDDTELLRFLVARRKDPVKAARMVKDMLQWRKDFKVDAVAPYPDEGALPCISLRRFPWLGDHDVDVDSSPYAECYKNVGGLGWHGIDKEGYPVYIERTGMHDAVGFPRDVPLDMAVDWHILLNEFSFDRLLKSVSKQRGTKVTKVTAIIDLRGLGWHMFQLAGLKIVQAFGKIDQDNYPERLHKVFVINAPAVFAKFWAFLKVGLDKRVIDKVRILDANFQKDLLEQIDAEVLPEFLGGKCTCSHMKTGCVPCYQPERLKDLDSFQQTIGARDVYTEEVDVEEAGAKIKYRFSTKDFNISFGIFYKESPTSTTVVEIAKVAVFESQTAPVIGTIDVEKKGVYLLKWDNSASMLRSKYLIYSFDIELPPVLAEEVSVDRLSGTIVPLVSVYSHEDEAQ